MKARKLQITRQVIVALSVEQDGPRHPVGNGYMKVTSIGLIYHDSGYGMSVTAHLHGVRYLKSGALDVRTAAVTVYNADRNGPQWLVEAVEEFTPIPFLVDHLEVKA